MSGSALATALAVAAGLAGSVQIAIMSRLGILLLAAGSALSLRK